MLSYITDFFKKIGEFIVGKWTEDGDVLFGIGFLSIVLVLILIVIMIFVISKSVAHHKAVKRARIEQKRKEIIEHYNKTVQHHFPRDNKGRFAKRS